MNVIIDNLCGFSNNIVCLYLISRFSDPEYPKNAPDPRDKNILFVAQCYLDY